MSLADGLEVAPIGGKLALLVLSERSQRLATNFLSPSTSPCQLPSKVTSQSPRRCPTPAAKASQGGSAVAFDSRPTSCSASPQRLAAEHEAPTQRKHNPVAWLAEATAGAAYLDEPCGPVVVLGRVQAEAADAEVADAFNLDGQAASEETGGNCNHWLMLPGEAAVGPAVGRIFIPGERNSYADFTQYRIRAIFVILAPRDKESQLWEQCRSGMNGECWSDGTNKG